MRFFHDFRLDPCLQNYQTEKFQKAICSRKSRHRAAYSHVIKVNPSTLDRGARAGAGRGAARRVSFWAWNCKESRDARVPFRAAVVAGLFWWSRRCRSKTRQQWMTGRLHLSLFVFSLQFIFGSFGRKECLNTPRPVHHELAVTVSHRATPILSPQLSGVEGVDLC